MADIVKVMLAGMVKSHAAAIRGPDLSLANTTVEYRGEGPNWCHLAIKGPHDQLPRVFEIKITEKMG